MKLAKLSVLAPLFLTAFAQDLGVAGVKQAFDKANIPNDLKVTFNPKFLLEVVLPQSEGAPILVHAGIQIPTRNDTAIQPIFALLDPSHPTVNAGPGPFVIAALDPDAPSPTNTSNAQVRHFLGGDFFPRTLPGQASGSSGPLLANTTAPISGWRQPTPTMGNHRYVFLAFRQPAGFDQQTLVSADTPIQHFDIAQFAEAVGLGDPIAGTFMMVANPDSP